MDSPASSTKQSIPNYQIPETLPPKLILFDGVCHLCTQSVQFIIKQDPNALFKFASLQSAIGLALRKQLDIPTDILSTLVYIENASVNQEEVSSKVYLKSDAILQIGIRLGWPWKLALLGFVVPKFLRDRIYHVIAQHRYSWFGKYTECWLPTKELQQRFLDL